MLVSSKIKVQTVFHRILPVFGYQGSFITNFIAFGETQNSFRSQTDPGLQLNTPAEVLKCHGAIKRGACERLGDVLVEVHPKMHVALCMINTSIIGNRVFLHSLPAIRRQIFFVFFVAVEIIKISHYCRSRYAKTVSDHLKRCRFLDPLLYMQLMIELFPFLLEIWIIRGSPLLPHWNIRIVFHTSHRKSQLTYIFFDLEGGIHG